MFVIKNQKHWWSPCRSFSICFNLNLQINLLRCENLNELWHNCMFFILKEMLQLLFELFHFAFLVSVTVSYCTNRRQHERHESLWIALLLKSAMYINSPRQTCYLVSVSTHNRIWMAVKKKIWWRSLCASAVCRFTFTRTTQSINAVNGLIAFWKLLHACEC